MDKATLHPDLEPIANKASYRQIFDLLYTLARCRYATFKQLHPLNHRIATKNNLVRLTELDYLKPVELVKNGPAYHITEKTREILKREGYNTEVLQKSFTGNALHHALKITDCLLNLQGQSFFYQVFYPIFREPPDYRQEFLRPDFAVVWKDGNRVKLQFGEVETEKPDWENYLLKKREKYEAIAQDKNTKEMWWKCWSERLRLLYGDDFCFSVLCSKQTDWKGWGCL